MPVRIERPGTNPEDHQERPIHCCPACDREFRGIADYPEVHVTSTTILRPQDVPLELPHWYGQDLLPKPREGWNRTLVPEEVLEYFHDHPNDDQLVHSDGYIYHRPYPETQEYRRQAEAYPEAHNRPGTIRVDEGRYMRHYNHAPAVRALLEQNDPLRRYLLSLQDAEGLIVATSNLFPDWEPDFAPGTYRIPSESDDALSGRSRGRGRSRGHRGYLLGIDEGQDQVTTSRVAEVGIWTDGPNMGSAGGPTIERVLTIAHINYEGRIHQL